MLFSELEIDKSETSNDFFLNINDVITWKINEKTIGFLYDYRSSLKTLSECRIKSRTI